MSSPKKCSLKVVMNKHQNKVLFAEANSDFVDVLLSFLALPLGRVASILRSHYGDDEAAAVGSLNTLHKGLQSLDDAYFCAGGAKQMLLNPPTPFALERRSLAIDIAGSATIQYFVCENQCSVVDRDCRNISLYPDIASCSCGKPLSRELRVNGFREGGVGAFTVDPLSFIVTDDLCVSPMTRIVQTLSDLGIGDAQGGELFRVSFGVDEVRDLLKFSLISATPLTDAVLKKTGLSSTAAKPECGSVLLHNIPKNSFHSRKVALKVCLQKSTDKFLFAVAMDDFVELLFSFLSLPLGGVEFLLGGKTCLKNIDNLHRSVSNGIDDMYFRTPDTKTRLMNPKLAHGYVSKTQFLPLCAEDAPKLYVQCKVVNGRRQERFFQEREGLIQFVSSFKLNEERFLKKRKSFIVTDDLAVSPSLATSVLILNRLGIPLSDVKEMELQIGLEEALRVPKASLTSKTALTDALIKPLLNKSPKLEP